MINEPPPDLFHVGEKPVPTGDKGRDAIQLASAYMSMRGKVQGWVDWYNSEFPE